MNYLSHLERIAAQDIKVLRQKDAEYGASWKKRGGVGAFMMLARKMDRIEEQVRKYGWDVFAAVNQDQRAEGLMDDLRDLRRYILLVEAELRELEIVLDEEAV